MALGLPSSAPLRAADAVRHPPATAVTEPLEYDEGITPGGGQATTLWPTPSPTPGPPPPPARGGGQAPHPHPPARRPNIPPSPRSTPWTEDQPRRAADRRLTQSAADWAGIDGPAQSHAERLTADCGQV